MLKRQQAESIKNVTVEDPFWTPLQNLVMDVVIPYQKAILEDAVPGAEKSHAIENFRIAAGESRGEFYGMVFQDSDVAKWLEAAAYSLVLRPDAELERQADELIALIGPRAAAGRLPGHLLHRQGAGTQMAKPGRMPRALLAPGI